MKLCRIFIKPTGERWFMMQLREEQNAQTVFSAMKSEGGIVHPAFFVPTEAVHYVEVFEAEQAPANLADMPAFGTKQ